MPYLGNSPVAGDHVNNFKVLDDISSHTATFDGSASTIVDTTNNTIRVVEHRFIQGQRVVYTNGGGGNIGGLTTGTAYFIIFDTAFTFKLATSASNAANSTAINLSSVGTGSSHTLNAAFDGVNTKFKITYQGGEPARFNNATQLNIAINNVIQRPNLSATTFTEGFAIEDHHKIVFKTAPTSEDIFWGSIIANTLTTFDISDHKIDTFTGDGSTTEFTLSHTPANNESLMVSINGVLQHPSNASTARAYTLIASIIQFTAAPGVGDEIQVRHLGFAGATTADVSGFYGRTGNVVLGSTDHITTGDITSRNINAGIVTATSFDGTFSSSIGGSNANFTGIVTAGTFKGGNIDAVDGAFSGNVTIGGTLTYEDVTNIDSVGIITAQEDVHVGAGLSVVGVSTLTGRIFAGGTVIPGYSGADDLTIGTESGNHGITIRSSTTGGGGLFFSDATSAGDNGTQWAGGVEYSHGNGELRFYQGETVRGMFKGGHFQPWLDSTGALGTTSKRWSNVHADAATIAGNATITGDLDVDAHTNLDNVSIAGVTTIANNKELVIGEQADSQYNTVIKQIPSGSTGSLSLTTRLPRIYAHDTRIIDKDNGNTHAYFWPNQIGLYANGSEKLQIVGGGVNILNGNLSVSRDLDVDGHTNLDNVSISGITTSNQINISSSGPRLTFSDSNENPDFYIEVNASQFLIQDATNNAQRFRIQSTGTVDIAGNLNCDSGIDVVGDITSTGNITISNTTPTLTFTDTDANPDFQIKANTGHFYFVDATNNQTRFYVSPDGSTNFEGNLNANRDFSVERHTNLDNVSIAGVTTFSDRAYLAHDLTISGTAPRVIFTDTNNNSDYRINVDAGNFEVQDVTNSYATRFRIKSDGNVGINDTDPSYKLNVIGDNAAYNGIGMLKGIIGVQNDTTAFGSSPTAGISFQTKYRTGPDVPLDVAAIWGGKENSTNGDKDGYMGFATREEGGSGDQERMRITSGGQILIGTTSPLSFNGVGQHHNLIVAGSTSDTDITDNSYAAITISNKDGTANNTAGLHFAREDTDGNPHYDGASIVAQFKETMNTGQYPKTDLAFLVSPANNNAPQEKMRLSADGNLSINTTANVQKLRVYDSRGAAGYKTALFESNDTTNGTRIVIANTGNTAGRGLGINVGGQSYGPGQDRASLGWYNPDNTFSYVNALTLTADGVMAHGQFANFAYSSLPAFFNIINGARVNTGGANQYAAPKGGFCDNARYELEASLISYSTSAQQTIQAINGAQLKITNSRNNWSYYNNLPNYLLGHAATDCINTSNYTLTLKATMTVFLQRSNGWNSVPLSGWELLESDTNIYPGATSSRLYVKTLAAGSYSGWDSDSAMYFFVL